VVAVFSRHAAALAWAAERLAERFGPIALSSEPYAFHHTAYYEPSMGPALVKLLHLFQTPVDPERLAEIKLLTNELEAELAAAGRFPERRPLNLDPGLLHPGKFTLATTKDQAHRIYLRQGIYAEVTLSYREGAYVPLPWTYADYREPHVLAFLKQARELGKRRKDM